MNTLPIKQFLLALLRWFISLVIILLVFIALLLSPLGLKIALDVGSKFLPGTLQYQHASGVIIGPIKLTGIRYSDQQQTTTIGSLKLDWRLTALLKGELWIKNLHINNVHVLLHENNSSTKNTTSSLELPIAIKITQATIHHITVSQPKKKTLFYAPSLHINGTLATQHSKLQIYTTIEKPIKIQATLQLSGTPKRYQFQLVTKSPYITGTFNGNGSLAGMQLTTKNTQLLQGYLDAQLQLNWNHVLRWQLTAAAKQLNLSQWDPKLPKNVTATIQSNGIKAPNTAPKFTLAARLKTGTAYANINIARQDQWQGRWDIAIQKLADIIPQANGSLYSSGRIHGSLKKPISTGTVTAQALNLWGYQVATLKAQWSINMTQPQASKIDLLAKQIAINGWQLTAVNLQGKGDLKVQRLTGMIKQNHTQIQFNVATKHIHQDTWQGLLNTLRIVGDTGTWQLHKPVQITMSKQRIVWNPFCLKGSYGGILCLIGQWQKTAPWAIKVDGKRISPKLITKLAAPKITLNSLITINAEIKGQGQQIRGVTAKLHFSPGSVSYQAQKKSIDQSFKTATLTVLLNQKGLRSDWRLAFAQNNRVSGYVTLPGYQATGLPKSSQKISGKIHINIPNLRFLQALTPHIIRPRGNITADLTIQGTLGAITTTGPVKLVNGSVYIPPLNLNLRRIHLALTAHNNIIQYALSAQSKNKPLKAVGEVNISAKGITTKSKISGNNVLVINTAQYKVYVSPEIEVQSQGEHLKIAGEIAIPKATLSPQEFHNTVVLPENEVVFIGKTPKKLMKALNIEYNIKLTLGNSVYFNTNSASGQLLGSLTIISSPKRGINATGAITIKKGTYRAIGRIFTIEPGSTLSYAASPIDNPNLNIRAARTIKNVSTTGIESLTGGEFKVGVQVQGTFKYPKFSLFSNAPLSQADTLSYLVLGTSIDTPGIKRSDNLSLLLQAVSALNLGGGKKGGGITEEIRQGLGLDELGFETRTTLDAIGNPIARQTSFVIGKYLTKRLYIRYSLGLSLTGQGINTNEKVDLLQLRYFLSKHWILQASTNTDSSQRNTGDSYGEGTGVDILYTTVGGY